MSIAIGISCYSNSYPKCLFTVTTARILFELFVPTTATSALDTPCGASLIIGISCYRYLLRSVSPGKSLPPRMPPTYTSIKNLLECCILNSRPNSSRHFIWACLTNGIFCYRYPLQLVSFARDIISKERGGRRGETERSTLI